MSKVIFKFNDLNNEISRVFNCLKTLEFYDRNNYPINLPKIEKYIIQGLLKNKIDKDIEAKFEKIIKDNYDKDKFDKQIQEIEKKWRENELEFFIKSEKLLQIEPLKKYYCNFTQYGVCGSYNPPDLIIINIVTCKNITKTIAHEIIHLMIHDLIEKYKISHWEKERLVDLYINDIYGGEIFQNIEDNELIKKVDCIYKKYKFQGIKKVISKLE